MVIELDHVSDVQRFAVAVTKHSGQSMPVGEKADSPMSRKHVARGRPQNDSSPFVRVDGSGSPDQSLGTQNEMAAIEWPSIVVGLEIDVHAVSFSRDAEALHGSRS